MWVGIGSVLLLHERLSGWFWLGMAIALGGAALILGADLLHPATAARLGLGDLMALIAGVFFGSYLLTAGRVRSVLSTAIVMTLATAAGSATLLLASLFLGQPLWGYSLQSWLALLGLGFISQLGGVALINFALGHLPTALVSVTLLAQPVLVALLGTFLLGEALGPVQMAGGFLVIAGIYLVHRRGR